MSLDKKIKKQNFYNLDYDKIKNEIDYSEISEDSNLSYKSLIRSKLKLKLISYSVMMIILVCSSFLTVKLVKENLSDKVSTIPEDGKVVTNNTRLTSDSTSLTNENLGVINEGNYVKDTLTIPSVTTDDSAVSSGGMTQDLVIYQRVLKESDEGKSLIELFEIAYSNDDIAYSSELVEVDLITICKISTDSKFVLVYCIDDLLVFIESENNIIDYSFIRNIEYDEDGE